MCETCLHFDEYEGNCRKGLADEWQCRDCDTSECPEYKIDPFYEGLIEV